MGKITKDPIENSSREAPHYGAQKEEACWKGLIFGVVCFSREVKSLSLDFVDDNVGDEENDKEKDINLSRIPQRDQPEEQHRHRQYCLNLSLMPAGSRNIIM